MLALAWEQYHRESASPQQCFAFARLRKCEVSPLLERLVVLPKEFLHLKKDDLARNQRAEPLLARISQDGGDMKMGG